MLPFSLYGFLAIVFFCLIVIKIWLTEAKDNEGKQEKKVSVISSSERDKNSHLLGYSGVVAAGLFLLIVKKIISLEFGKACLDFMENFAPTLFSGFLHLVERTYTEKQTDAKDMLESWSWMQKVARVTADIIKHCGALSESSGLPPGPDGPPSKINTAPTSPQPQCVPSSGSSSPSPGPVVRPNMIATAPTRSMSDAALILPREQRPYPFVNTNTSSSTEVQPARQRPSPPRQNAPLPNRRPFRH